MGLWDMIRGAEKARGGNYSPRVANQSQGNPSLSASALGALRGIGVGKKNGRE